jgi:quercetin dioxygenase-like cupin family protein
MQKLSLTAIVRQQLEGAHRSSSGRTAETVYGGHERALRQTVIAMVEGQTLAEHSTSGEATLQVLSGRVRLSAGATVWDGMAGDLIVIPNERHGLLAIEDAAVLLTVVVTTGLDTVADHALIGVEA